MKPDPFPTQTRAEADNLLPDPLVDDLANDWVENELGRLDFHQNWKQVRPVAEQRVSKWLAEIGVDKSIAFKVVNAIDEMHRKGLFWDR